MKYPYIRAWHYRSGSFQYYINEQVKAAEKDGAPQNAIYKSGNGEWRTIDDVTNLVAKEEVEEWVKKHSHEKVADDND